MLPATLCSRTRSGFLHQLHDRWIMRDVLSLVAVDHRRRVGRHQATQEGDNLQVRMLAAPLHVLLNLKGKY